MAVILSVGAVHLSPLAGRDEPSEAREREGASPRVRACRKAPSPRLSPRRRGERSKLLGAEFLGLGDPAIDAARQADLLADIVGSGRAKACDLPVMEDAQIVELLLDRRRYAGKLLEVVGNTAGPGQRLEAQSIGLIGPHILGNRLLGSADV